MKKFAIVAAALVAGGLLAGCTGSRTGDGALIGGATGAAVGAVATGSTGGALVGAGVGAVAGAIIADSTGRCYYRNRYGERVYTRCR
ncbi:glycine zipper domain-containing protein [Prosthecomicrobium pneumaticum]|nr:glycine zipper domain-containing protein [Prosthecomicrobium pneumaticum]